MSNIEFITDSYLLEEFEKFIFNNEFYGKICNFNPLQFLIEGLYNEDDVSKVNCCLYNLKLDKYTLFYLKKYNNVIFNIEIIKEINKTLELIIYKKGISINSSILLSKIGEEIKQYNELKLMKLEDHPFCDKRVKIV